MLSEHEIKIIYEVHRGIVHDAENEVTLDRHVVEAEIQAQILAKVLEIHYDPPIKRKKKLLK